MLKNGFEIAVIENVTGTQWRNLSALLGESAPPLGFPILRSAHKNNTIPIQWLLRFLKASHFTHSPISLKMALGIYFNCFLFKYFLLNVYLNQCLFIFRGPNRIKLLFFTWFYLTWCFWMFVWVEFYNRISHIFVVGMLIQYFIINREKIYYKHLQDIVYIHKSIEYFSILNTLCSFPKNV